MFTKISISRMFFVLLAVLMMSGSAAARSLNAAQEPQPTPTGFPIKSQSDPPLLISAQASDWYEGSFVYSYNIDCYTYAYEEETAYWVGYWANPSAGEPTPNTIYYVHVVAYVVGVPCLYPGTVWTSYFDIGLPAGTSLAISTANPVYCFFNGDLFTPQQGCPQTLPASTYNSGMMNIPYPSASKAWPMSYDVVYEFQIPVISTTTLSNSTLQAKIKHTYNTSSDWLNPTKGVNVYPAFAKSSPANGATNQSINPTLTWASSAGAIRYEYCIDKTNDNTCNINNWVSVGTATSKALSGLSPGTVYSWQVRVVKTGGTSYANGNTWWSFTTANPPGAFNKSNPTNGVTNQSTSPTLSWGSSPDATSYEYCYDTTNDNTCSSWTGNSLSTSKVLSGLSANTTYYWQVRANNSSGTTYANTNTWWSFTTGGVISPPIVTMNLKSVGAKDGWVLESTEGSSVGGTRDATATTFNLGDDAADKQYRAILHFNTSSLPDTAVITKVTLKIKKQGQVGTNPFNVLGGLLVDMRKPAFGSVALAIGDFEAAAGKAAVATFGVTPVSNWYSAVLNGPGRNYVNKNGNTQFRLEFATDDNDDMGADYMKFFSGNAAGGSRPQLMIEYYVP